jgi:hypothetical protein
MFRETGLLHLRAESSLRHADRFVWTLFHALSAVHAFFRVYFGLVIFHADGLNRADVHANPASGAFFLVYFDGPDLFSFHLFTANYANAGIAHNPRKSTANGH